MLGGFLADNVLCLLAYKDEYCKIVRNSIPLNLYSGPHRIIASRTYDYIDRYNTSPKDHLPDILEDKINDPSTGEIYQQTITAIRETSEGLNAEFAMSQVQRFVERQSVRSFVVEVTKAVQRDTEEGLDEAARLIRTYRNIQVQLFDPGTRLNDKKRALKFLDDTNECFPTGIPELDIRGFGPTRKEMIMLIANAKMGKCIAEGEYVLLADGSYVPVEQVKESDSVASLNKTTILNKEISKTINNGVKDVVKVITRSGRQVILTPEHPLLTKHGWCPLNTLNVGDSIAVPHKLRFFGNESEERHKLRFLGYMIADGGMSVPNTPSFSKCDTEIVDDMQRCLELMGDKLNAKKDLKGQYRIVSNKPWCPNSCNSVAFLRQLGLMNKKSNEKFIPEFVFRLKKELIAEFLAALFTCDGSVYKSNTRNVPKFDYSTTSRKLAIQITHLLQRFGIFAKVRERWQIVSEQPYVSWLISFSSRNYLFTLRDEIKLGFTKGRKLHDLLDCPTPRTNRKSYLLTDTDGDIFYDKIVSIKPAGQAKVYDLSVPETHNFIANDIIVHNSFWLTHLAKMSIIHRLKVLHITLEMSEERCAQRYFQTLFSISKRPDNHSSIKFDKDQEGKVTAFKQIRINPRHTLRDDNIRDLLEKYIDTHRLRWLDNIIIKEFPTGSLTVEALEAHLDTLITTENFTPDMLVIDYPDLMKRGKGELRIELDLIFQRLRGIAVERNLALAVVSQSNRAAAKQKTVDGTGVAEAYSKVQHADVTLTLSATTAEKRLGLARLFVTAGRNDEGNLTLVISQHYRTGTFVIDAAVASPSYWEQLPDDEAEE